MSRDLVRENFRFANGSVAANRPVTVVLRGTNTPVTLYTTEFGFSQVPNPMTSDAQGQVAFYAESGFYDFLAVGARIPFDVEPDVTVEIGPEELDQVTDMVLQELELPDLVLLLRNAQAG